MRATADDSPVVRRGSAGLRAAVFLLVAGGCSVVSPPPMRMLNESVLRREPGAVTVAAAGAIGAGIWGLGPAAGGEAAVSVQATRELGVEVLGGAGHRTGVGPGMHGAPAMLAFGRLGGNYRPLDWLTLGFGAGAGGADTGLSWGTADLALSFGRTLAGVVRPYGGLTLAVSVPITAGPSISDGSFGFCLACGAGGVASSWDTSTALPPTTTLWAGVRGGVAVLVTRAFEIGLEVLADSGWGARKAGIILGGMGVLRYTFGQTGVKAQEKGP